MEDGKTGRGKGAQEIFLGLRDFELLHYKTGSEFLAKRSGRNMRQDSRSLSGIVCHKMHSAAPPQPKMEDGG